MTSDLSSKAHLPLEAALARHAEAFRERFGPGSPSLYFSPGRVNLMGAHLDYNQGPVMPTAIDRGTFLALRRRSDRRVRFASTFDPRTLELELDELPGQRLRFWADYPLGVLRELLLARGGSQDLCGVEILFGGNLPVGAGLSSSASICVGTALALDRAYELRLERLDLVRSALAAERGFVGVQCGIMDPYAVGFARAGHLLWLDCKDRSFEHLPFDFESLRLAVVDSGVRRELAEGAFNRRVEECRAAFELLRVAQPEALCLRDVQLATLEERRRSMDPTLARRAEHVIREVGRTFEARERLLAGEPDQLGALMSRTHASLRELFEVSCPELDLIVEVATGSEGALGARLTGAGFGGCAVVLLRRGAEEQLERRLHAAFRARFGRAPRVQHFGGDPGPRALEGA